MVQKNTQQIIAELVAKIGTAAPTKVGSRVKISLQGVTAHGEIMGFSTRSIHVKLDGTGRVIGVDDKLVTAE